MKRGFRKSSIDFIVISICKISANPSRPLLVCVIVNFRVAMLASIQFSQNILYACTRRSIPQGFLQDALCSTLFWGISHQDIPTLFQSIRDSGAKILVKLADAAWIPMRRRLKVHQRLRFSSRSSV